MYDKEYVVDIGVDIDMEYIGHRYFACLSVS